MLRTRCGLRSRSTERSGDNSESGGGGRSCRAYVAGSPGQCYASIARHAADAFVTQVVIARLSQPDAADPFRVESATDDIEAELRSIRQRREELADLVADGVLSAGLARPRLVALAEQMAVLEARRAPGAVSFDQTVRPEDV